MVGVIVIKAVSENLDLEFMYETMSIFFSFFFPVGAGRNSLEVTYKWASAVSDKNIVP